MKGFIRNTLKFLLFLLVIHLAASFLFNEIVYTNSYIVRKDNDFKQKMKDTEVLILGDSHPEAAIMPERMESAKVYNFASSGESYIQTYYKLRKIIDKMPQLRIVVLPFDPHSFSPKRETRFTNYRYWSQYIDFFGSADLYRKRELQEEWLIREVVPYFNGKEKIIQSIKSHLENGLTPIEDGYRPHTADFSYLDKKERKARAENMIKYQIGNSKPVSGILWRYFNMTIQLAKNKGIEVIIVSYPLTDEYLQSVNERPNIKITNYPDPPGSLVYFDYSGFFKGKTNLFHDPNHLNNKGAKIFTQELEKKIIQYL